MENTPDQAQKPAMLYQYRPAAAWAFGNLYRRVLYFNSPLNFNDPHDFRYPPSLRNMTDDHFAFFREAFNHDKDARYRRGESKDEFAARVNEITAARFAKLREQVGLACFSQYNNHLAMWSHYGGRGAGFCLAFDTRGEGLFGGANLAKMQYWDKLPDAADALNDHAKSRQPFAPFLICPRPCFPSRPRLTSPRKV